MRLIVCHSVSLSHHLLTSRIRRPIRQSSWCRLLLYRLLVAVASGRVVVMLVGGASGHHGDAGNSEEVFESENTEFEQKRAGMGGRIRILKSL